MARTTNRNVLAAILAVALFTSACSDDASTAEVAAEESDAETTATDATEAAESDADESDLAGSEDESSDAALAEAELITIEPDVGPSVGYVSSALGGVRFEIPEGSQLLIDGDNILVTDQAELDGRVGESDDPFAYAAVSLHSMFASGIQLESVEVYLRTIRAAGVDAEPTGTKIEVLGFEMVGYQMTGGSDDLFLFGSQRFGAPVQSASGPAENTLEFIADTPSGVFTVGVANPGGDNADWLPVLGRVLASLEFTGPGLDPTLPSGETIEFEDGGPPPPAAEASDDAAFPPLGEPFSPIEPGRYELLNFGMPVSVEVADGWFVQPNFPGVVVLTDAGSIGPGDREVVWINDIRELAPIAGGPIRSGDALAVDDIEAIIADPPSGLVIDEVERFDLTAENGSTTPVVSFTVSVDPSSACSPDDPCDYAFITSYGFVKELWSTHTNRVWFFPEHPTGPAAAVLQAPRSSDWATEGVALMASLELSR